MLAKWHDHYGRLVGPENPYVVSHGRDDRHREITPEASHITVPRDILKGFVGRRQRSLADLQKSLSPCYDAVRRVDVDELVFVDPACHDSLQDCFAATDLDMTDAWFALGFNLFAMDPEVSVDLNSPGPKRCGTVSSPRSIPRPWPHGGTASSFCMARFIPDPESGILIATRCRVACIWRI